MSRFFVDETAVKGGMIEITDRDDLKHLSKVLRLAAGDEIDVSDSREYEYRVKLTEVTAEKAAGHIIDKQKFAREPETLVTLYQGIPKQGKMEEIIQKSIELGVNRIVPVFTERTVVKDTGGLEKKVQRWRKVASETVKQCRRGIIPEVSEPLTFIQLTEELKKPCYDAVLLLYEEEDKSTIKDGLKDAVNGTVGYGFKVRTTALIVGPEGGFSKEEAEQLQLSGAESVSLGAAILRTETAGPAAIAMVMYELEL